MLTYQKKLAILRSLVCVLAYGPQDRTVYLCSDDVCACRTIYLLGPPGRWAYVCASADSLRFILCEAGHYVPRYILGVFSPLRDYLSALWRSPLALEYSPLR